MNRLLPSLHPAVSWFNVAGKCLHSISWQQRLLSPESLLSKAERATGLTDWGREDDFRTALEYVTTPDSRRMELTPAGYLFLRAFLLDRLTSRLRIRQQLADHPGVLQVRINRPLIILGLPRTGTTLLQNLLSLDPLCNPLRHWFTTSPAPSPLPDQLDSDPRIGKTERNLRRFYRLAPELTSIHYSSAQRVEECLLLLMNSLMTDVFSMFTDFRGYEEWLADQDMLPAYRYYRQQLQILQWKLPDNHWVLKAPVHLAHLPELLTVLPGCSVVQMHRDPQATLPSIINMRIKLLALFNSIPATSLPGITRQTLASFQKIVEKGIADRQTEPAAIFLDIQYNELVQDPVGTIRKIYDYFDYPWSGLFEQRMEQWLQENPKGKHGVQEYAMEEYGLSAAAIERSFGRYRDYYSIEREEHCLESGKKR
jgi:hypothetical protein